MTDWCRDGGTKWPMRRPWPWREEQLVRGSEQGRQNAKASLDATPVNKPKSFQDYRQSKLSQEYPPGSPRRATLRATRSSSAVWW